VEWSDHQRDGNDQPEDDRQAESVGPLKAQEQPKAHKPQREVKKIEKNRRQKNAPAKSRKLAQVVFAHLPTVGVVVQ